ncbi:MAG TPA: hypothetical protein VLF91_01630 [Candidatus Saccharimonadales bacterium]|nr:hypothetical protein [Candidatus Saccharimonadales bacterium]
MFGQNNNDQATDNVMPTAPASEPPAAPADNSVVDATSTPMTGYGSDAASPVGGAGAPVDSTVDNIGAGADDKDNLLDIKQQALQQLSPLLGHLDQTPEEKFRTTMMMIQAADNSALLKEAYTAAEQISDEKTKAQALLDIVNEINYFTSQDQ